MVTGDHPATARAIAAEAGLLDVDGLLLEGKDLPPDEQVLGAGGGHGVDSIIHFAGYKNAGESMQDPGK